MAQGNCKLNMYEPLTYRICIQGELDQRWFDHFGARSVVVDTDQTGHKLTTFSSDPVDQSALVGLINRLNTLGVALISVSATRRPDAEASNEDSDQTGAPEEPNARDGFSTG